MTGEQTTPPTPPALAGLADAVTRLRVYGGAAHPIAARDAAAAAGALADGLDAGEALRRAGAAPAVARFVEIAEPAELPAVLDELARALGRARERSARVRRASLYPMTLLVAALSLAGIAALLLMPVAGRLLAEAGARALPASVTALAPAVMLGAVLVLAWLALGLRGLAPFPGLGRALDDEDRALVLATAAAAAASSVELQAALRAAAALATRPRVVAAAAELARALEAGAPDAAARALLGDVRGALLAGACAQGAGGDALVAIAAHAERRALAGAHAAVALAQIVTLVAGGAAVLAAAVALYLPYVLLLDGLVP